jgi:hypothetical protein
MGGNRNGFRERPKDASRARPKATPGIQCFKCDKRCRNADRFRSATTPGAALVLVLAFALDAAPALLLPFALDAARRLDPL